jgi:hypothetical protein
MSGTDIGEYTNRGINYRALDDLFELNRQRTVEVGGAGAAGAFTRAWLPPCQPTLPPHCL